MQLGCAGRVWQRLAGNGRRNGRSRAAYRNLGQLPIYPRLIEMLWQEEIEPRLAPETLSPLSWIDD